MPFVASPTVIYQPQGGGFWGHIPNLLQTGAFIYDSIEKNKLQRQYHEMLRQKEKMDLSPEDQVTHDTNQGIKGQKIYNTPGAQAAASINKQNEDLDYYAKYGHAPDQQPFPGVASPDSTPALAPPVSPATPEGVAKLRATETLPPPEPSPASPSGEVLSAATTAAPSSPSSPMSSGGGITPEQAAATGTTAEPQEEHHPLAQSSAELHAAFETAKLPPDAPAPIKASVDQVSAALPVATVNAMTGSPSRGYDDSLFRQFNVALMKQEIASARATGRTVSPQAIETMRSEMAMTPEQRQNFYEARAQVAGLSLDDKSLGVLKLAAGDKPLPPAAQKRWDSFSDAKKQAISLYLDQVVSDFAKAAALAPSDDKRLEASKILAGQEITSREKIAGQDITQRQAELKAKETDATNTRASQDIHWRAEEEIQRAQAAAMNKRAEADAKRITASVDKETGINYRAEQTNLRVLYGTERASVDKNTAALAKLLSPAGNDAATRLAKVKLDYHKLKEAHDSAIQYQLEETPEQKKHILEVEADIKALNAQALSGVADPVAAQDLMDNIHEGKVRADDLYRRMKESSDFYKDKNLKDIKAGKLPKTPQQTAVHAIKEMKSLGEAKDVYAWGRLHSVPDSMIYAEGKKIYGKAFLPPPPRPTGLVPPPGSPGLPAGTGDRGNVPNSPLATGKQAVPPQQELKPGSAPPTSAKPGTTVLPPLTQEQVDALYDKGIGPAIGDLVDSLRSKGITELNPEIADARGISKGMIPVVNRLLRSPIAYAGGFSSESSAKLSDSLYRGASANKRMDYAGAQKNISTALALKHRMRSSTTPPDFRVESEKVIADVYRSAYQKVLNEYKPPDSMKDDAGQKIQYLALQMKKNNVPLGTLSDLRLLSPEGNIREPGAQGASLRFHLVKSSFYKPTEVNSALELYQEMMKR